jgi:toxin-antitoxin system PIN domain toxin
VIVPDVNLLVYAYNADAPEHASARRWWEDALSAPRCVGLAWVAVLGFVRIMTSRSVVLEPMTPDEATGHVRSWLERPQVGLLVPGPRHLDVFGSLLHGSGGGGALATDAHLAALAIESQAELHSNDADFARFPGLRWRDPLG